MNAADVIDDLTRRDVRLGVHGDQLHVDAPRGVLTESDRRRIVEFKSGIIGVLMEAIRQWNFMANADPVCTLVYDAELDALVRPDADGRERAVIRFVVEQLQHSTPTAPSGSAAPAGKPLDSLSND